MLGKRLVIWRILFYLAVLTVLTLSLLPLEQPDFSPNDKINHVLGYVVLALLGCFAHQQKPYVWLGVIAFGLLIEFLQGLTGYRFMSYADALANAVGASVGIACAYGIEKLGSLVRHKRGL